MGWEEVVEGVAGGAEGEEGVEVEVGDDEVHNDVLWEREEEREWFVLGC